MALEWSPTTWIIAASCAVFLGARHLSSGKLDPREPPVVNSAIPFVGHLLGMALYGGRYLKQIGIQNRQKTPVFTLPVPNSRIYIVTDPSLAAAVQRASKVLSFTPIIPEVTERILGLDKATVEIARKNLDPAPGETRGFLADIQDMVYTWLGPGDYLSVLTIAAANQLKAEVAEYIATLRARNIDADRVDLLVWVRHCVTVATAEYLYGPKNPIAEDPALEAAFWDFDHGLGMLLMNIMPSVTASKAYKGRERLVEALADYLEAGTYKTASKIVQERVSLALQHGWTLRATARSELSFLFAGIVNTTTSTFWILLQLFADSELLRTVRGEIEALVTTTDDDSAQVLAIDDLKNKCPMLNAVYRECLRLNSDNNSVRVVKEDTLLSDRWFLAKDSVVQIAGGVIHADAAIWGPDVETFDPKRFLGQQDKERQVHPAAFRAFGGGKTLCPGRHFAMNEILSFVALVVLQLDITGVDGGRIEVPRKNDGVLPVHILEPIVPVLVSIRPRKGYDERELGVVLKKV
ncbi:Cytochrome P450 [Mycena sanguinolenta]|uniref:Cytochrome P450 n=1 Tax=Mycena sanguinolenta TaxID=230812 RepID=A0A8H6XZI3_9AGAR|nr:Cytochrome P450 [Mycena sanguinolenta]